MPPSVQRTGGGGSAHGAETEGESAKRNRKKANALHTDALTSKRARKLRRDLTDAERILWSRLKGRRLGVQFRVQHPIAPYIADFACVSLKLVVEVDGATHSKPAEQAHDEHRRRELEHSGWTILRVWNDEVYRNIDGVLAAITDALQTLEAGRSPPPSR